MRELFPPPTHLRGRPEAIERALGTYRRALAGFDETVLRQAWQEVAQAHRYWTWPILSEIVRACEQVEKRAHQPQDGWVEKATALADAYVRRFMKCSAVAVRAREGGYERELEEYVREAGWVQAQYLAGRKDVGYVSSVLFGREKPSEEFFQRARVQAAKGCIQVRVPAEMIERWREAARGRPQSR